MPLIVVVDGGRHKKNTGYGALSRGLIRALSQHTSFQIAIEETQIPWDEEIPKRNEVECIPVVKDISSGDAVFRIGVPGPLKSSRVPTVFYTQNALGDLPLKWIEYLGLVDTIVVPGLFDKVVFDRYFPRVFTCPQFVDPEIFRPVERWRAEGPEEPAFLFVGSYSYRKGVDLLVPSFIEAFRNGPAATLRLHCATGFENEGFNHFLRQIRSAPEHLSFDVFNGSDTPAWMNRYLNRFDAVVTLSRGEGWCMPLYEALLCGKPVIAPRSTAMGEALPREGVRFVETTPQLIKNISDPFGKGMQQDYQTDSNVCFEPIQEDAVQAFRDIYSQMATYRAAARHARQFISEKYSLGIIGQKLTVALDATLKAKSPKMNRLTSDLHTSVKPGDEVRVAPLDLMDRAKVPAEGNQDPIQAVNSKALIQFNEPCRFEATGEWYSRSFPVRTLRPSFLLSLSMSPSDGFGAGEVQVLLRSSESGSYFWCSVHQGELQTFLNCNLEAGDFKKAGSIMHQNVDEVVIRLKGTKDPARITLTRLEIRDLSRSRNLSAFSRATSHIR
jgi:glycosyltransferase involved in cell wall biosynthesis